VNKDGVKTRKSDNSNAYLEVFLPPGSEKGIGQTLSHSIRIKSSAALQSTQLSVALSCVVSRAVHLYC